MSTIKNFEDLCNHFGADEPAGLNRRIYKDTGCGASISVRVVNPAAIQVEGDTLTLQLQVRENYYQPYRQDDDTDEAYAKKVQEFKGLYVLSLNHGIYNHGPNCYFTDTLKACHEGAFWYDEFMERIQADKLCFVCNYPDPMSFWPVVPRHGEPVTIETLKAAADGHVETCGLHHFRFIFKKPKTAAPEITVSAHVARQPNGIAQLLELKCGSWTWQQPSVFSEDFGDEPWFKSVMEFFDVGTDTPFKQIKDQTWEHKDHVTVEKKRNELVITKTFKASDRCFGWKTYPEQNEIWAHNGSELWNHITMDTKLLGFTIQSIVEGSDATVDSSEFVCPVDTKEVDDWIKEMEEETSRIWKAANTYLYEVVTKKKKQANYYVRLNWGDVEWEDEVPPKKLKEKVEKYLKEIGAEDLRTDLDGEAGFSLRYCEEPEYMY
jgi:hypothetical protein